MRRTKQVFWSLNEIILQKVNAWVLIDHSHPSKNTSHPFLHFGFYFRGLLWKMILTSFNINQSIFSIILYLHGIEFQNYRFIYIIFYENLKFNLHFIFVYFIHK